MRGSAMVGTGNSVERQALRGPAAFDQLLRLEQETIRLFLNQPMFVPGLFQIRAYATAMISTLVGFAPDAAALTERVDVRMQRAEAFAKRLHSHEPPHVWLPIDESVLRRRVGGAAVMREQIDQLITVSEVGTVHVAVIPFGHGAHPGLSGSVEVHEIASGEASVFFESPYADELVGPDKDLARQHRETVESMMASAVSGAEARTMLEIIRSEL